MTTQHTIALLAALSFIATPLMAQSNEAGSAPAAQNRGKNLTPEQKKKILKKFDKDGDGKLNSEEAAAAKAALLARKAKNNL